MKSSSSENRAPRETKGPLSFSRLWNTRAGNRILVGGIGTTALLLAFLYWMGIPLTGWLPPCPFHLLTGYNCPGCGTTRMLEALLSGNIAAAFSFNPFFFLAAVVTPIFFIWFFIRSFLKEWRPLHIDWHKRSWLLLLILFLLFGVVRNTPWYTAHFY